MKKLAFSIASLLFIVSQSLAQGCFPNANFAQEDFGLYPAGAINMDCGGSSASKTIVSFTDTMVNVEIVPGNPVNIVTYVDALRLDSVGGLPAGLEITTDVIATATTESPYGIWLNTGIVPNQTKATGCFSITGSNLAWLNASTGGLNNDGVYTITLAFDYRIAGTNPDISTIIPSGTWASNVPPSLFGDLIEMEVELNVNESGCVGGDLFVAPEVLADNFDTPSCDGSATIEVYNGTPPYAYTFSNGVTTQDATDLCPGVYSIEVTDALGAQSVAQFAVASSGNVLSNINQSIPNVTDSLYTNYNSCDLDYSLPLDSFFIVDAFTIGPDTCQVTWVAWQEGEPYTLETYYPFLGPEPTVFSLILWCQNGRSEAGVFQLYEFLDLSAPIGINQLVDELTFGVSPNPSTGLFELRFDDNKPKLIEVLDSKGALVYSVNTSGQTAHILNLENQPKGMYILKVNSTIGTGYNRLVKQ